MDLLSATALLLVTTDPLGNVPGFISILQPVPTERRRKVARLVRAEVRRLAPLGPPRVVGEARHRPSWGRRPA